MTRSAAKVDNCEQHRSDRNKAVWINLIHELQKEWAKLTDPKVHGGTITIRVDGKGGSAGAARVAFEKYIPPPS